MPNSIVRSVIREVEPLSADELIVGAARKVLDSGLPGLPAVEGDGAFVGIFGELEFMAALFPGYLGELGSGAMIRRSIDDAIEHREACRSETIREYLITDHVTVEDDYSDAQLTEIFLHHRVLVVPVATAGSVHGVVTRADFFAVLFKEFEAAGG
jgi:CBS domain-containing protein